MNGAAGPDDDTRGGQLEAPQPMPSFFTRRGLPYPSFSSSRPPKELRGGHSSGVRALAWNADGSVLVSSGHDRMVRAWRPDESVRGSLTQTDVRSTVELAGHTDQVSALACHPTHPQLLATGSLDRTVRLWDLRAPTAVRAVNTPGANINIAYHPSGDVLAVGDKNETVSLVDASSGALLHAIKNGLVDREEINELAWSPDGEHLLLPMGSGNVCFLQRPTALESDGATETRFGLHPAWQRVRIKPAHPAAIFSIKWDPTRRLVATTAADSTMVLWDAIEWDAVHVYSHFKVPPRCLDFSSDGEWLAVGGEGAYIELVRALLTQFSMAAQRSAHKLPVSATINTLAWHPSQPVLAYGGTEPSSLSGHAARAPPVSLYTMP